MGEGMTGRDIKTAITETRKIFEADVWPLWRDRLMAKHAISVEGGSSELEAAADFSGTDAFFVHAMSGILIPIASRIEHWDKITNNPVNFPTHYPRFTVRMARYIDGKETHNVECAIKLKAMENELSRRYMPYYTIQSLVHNGPNGCLVLQSSAVRTEDLFTFIKSKNYGSPNASGVSKGRTGDKYRIVPVEKLRAAGFEVTTLVT